MNEFYGIFDKNGTLWMDDFDSKEDADAQIECLNIIPALQFAAPFKAALIDG